MTGKPSTHLCEVFKDMATDEFKGQQEYTNFANRMDMMGHSDLAKNFRQMASDEGNHALHVSAMSLRFGCDKQK